VSLERPQHRLEVTGDVLVVVRLDRPPEPHVVHLAHVQALGDVLGEVVWVPGPREHGVERDLTRPPMV
jgi:hypothetical protein